MTAQPNGSRDMMVFEPSEAFAKQLDERDPLRHYRAQFHIPTRSDGAPVHYFTGNSLGLQPKGAAEAVEVELEDWQRLAVEGHFHGRHPWYSYHEPFREPAAAIVGAKPEEVVLMNSLTVNLHLLLVSFYRPSRERYKVLMEWPAFPSDTYAVQTQLTFHGHDPDEGMVVVKPREGEHTVRPENVIAAIEEHRDSLALVLLGGVNYYTGQLYDMPGITQKAHEHGITVGFDLAHAAGNVPLKLHEWDVDFACWCSYKYLNGGPGAIAGAFVHERQATNRSLKRFGGWWGTDPEMRFNMHLNERFLPVPRADAWQLSNPPILSLAPLRVSYGMFAEVGVETLREKSLKLTGFLEYLLEEHCRKGAAHGHAPPVEIVTPREPAQRGCQLSLLVHTQAEERRQRLKEAGIISDFRPPNVLRVAPVPLYNSFHDVWVLAQTLTNGG